MYRANNSYKRAALVFVPLMVFTLLGGYLSYKHTLVVDKLLPASKSVLPWTVLANSDAERNGQSRIQLHDAEWNLDYSFFLSDVIEYGYASVAMRFNSESQQHGFVDLSQYLGLRFRVKCSPANTLSFTVFTFDEKLTDVKNPDTYRIPTAFFSCDEQWGVADIDLRHLEVPEWWLNLHNVNLADRGYQLNHTSRFSFGVSLQSPKNVMSSVSIADVELIERDWRLFYAFLVFALGLWVVVGYWLSKNHIRMLANELEENVQRNKPLIPYQHLHIEPHQTREKSAVLRFMATEYANPDVSLDAATSAMGIGKAKINSILKNETGLTFSAYLNKLRLAEAARLLAEEPQANVSEIALSVGYNNVSYFNKLFKNEYGSSPKMFRSVSLRESKSAESTSSGTAPREHSRPPDEV